MATNVIKTDTDRIKGPWSPEEDDLLQLLVQKHGPRNWSLISKSISKLEADQIIQELRTKELRSTHLEAWISLEELISLEERTSFGQFSLEHKTQRRSAHRDDKRSDDRYRRDDKKEDQYKREDKTEERAVERSKERSKDRRMRTRGDKRPSRKHDRKVLVAEESTKSWADTDSESSSISSSSSDSEQEEVHCLMADQTSDDEVFNFSNVEFTREDLVSALNDMVKEYMKLSHSFEEAKAENISLKSSSIESSSDELEDIDSLKIELNKLTVENDLLRNESSELKAENSPKLNENGKADIGFQRPENSKPSWLKNKLDKDKAKAAGLKPRPAVKPGFPENNTTRKTTKPQRDMWSNPSTESNYKTAVNNKNKMQMLCMQPGTTAEGYNQEREPKNSMHSSTEICNRICGHAGTREQIPPAGTRRNTQNGVAPTNQNATVFALNKRDKAAAGYKHATSFHVTQRIQISLKRRRLGISRYQNTLRLDFTKSTNSHHETRSHNQISQPDLYSKYENFQNCLKCEI
ncbi:hypothetical protein F511_33766 [Dorcoceras hygrometricum]|uniref:Uncharacterized protein n=1 Tax=Dorcoceras hygrometricum TaxID=472368 RepID=A0A2Z7D5W8_9LAMI|nr:hypothetical protein F511_33766 [Dorcoceras hygrometricum]